MFWAFVIVILVIALMYAMDSQSPVSANGVSQQSSGSGTDWGSLADYDFEIVGESFHQKALSRITGGGEADDIEATVLLVPEDNNKYDKQAVKIEIRGMTVGHLSREDARRFRKLLQDKGLEGQVTSCSAVIRGGGEAYDGEELYYGVFLS